MFILLQASFLALALVLTNIAAHLPLPSGGGSLPSDQKMTGGGDGPDVEIVTKDPT